MGLTRTAPGVVLVEFVEHESRQECLLVFRELANAGGWAKRGRSQ
jgi:hypothetical protein